MVMPPDIEAEILCYYHVEKWLIGVIAGQLHVHHSVVTRVLVQTWAAQDRPASPAVADRRGE